MSGLMLGKSSPGSVLKGIGLASAEVAKTIPSVLTAGYRVRFCEKVSMSPRKGARRGVVFGMVGTVDVKQHRYARHRSRVPARRIKGRPSSDSVSLRTALPTGEGDDTCSPKWGPKRP